MAVLSACTSDGLELEPSARLDPDRAAPARASSGLAPVAEPPPGPAAAPLAEPEPDGAIGPAASSSGYPARHHRALSAASSASFPSASASSAAPSAGVDVDGMLGAPAVKGLAEEEAEQIAEGRSSQPVVDGIGGEVHAVAPRRLPEPESGPPPAIDPDLPPLPPRAGAARAERRSDARPPTRAGEDQVAFIPRLVPKSDAPMSLPAPPDGTMPADEVACRRQLKALGVTYREVPRITNGPTCGIEHPVKVSGLSGNIAVSPAVTLNCQTSVAFASWVKNELAPAARLRYLSGVAVVKPMGGYSCRPMNNRRGNPMSEHAHGNAIDIGTFILKSGKEIDVRKPGFFAFREKGLLKAVRADSCKYFNTVLGPGSDPQHKDHFHFDLRDRRCGYRHCD
ncbi:hypothetical protein BJF92_11450 [Rhizobium rhizosphaerae]|uniref:Extensin-like C-terminal domain-containing protein n=1 Tax=Xaviernesmea rhizosphaerae TaxID=1672749 RepID=A0A1Q9ANJ6_9HYPH|nr:extensin family protein [Xaviernesmea rhizosphaerae]OLP56931.1 hypothetical protein BJF92_11450 [Xaviernesmea rhizosphaerae]